jgi:hypothetical protein
MSYIDGPKGVGGWLAFFLVTLGIFSPATTIFSLVTTLNNPQIATAYGEKFQLLSNLEWGLGGATCLLCWFACYRFLMVFNWTTVLIGIGTLASLAVMNILIEPMLVSYITAIPFDTLFQAMGAESVRPLVYTGIWTTYLLRSERVSNTYRPQAEDDDIAEVFE